MRFGTGIAAGYSTDFGEIKQIGGRPHAQESEYRYSAMAVIRMSLFKNSASSGVNAGRGTPK
jgi:hypothetical protein